MRFVLLASLVPWLAMLNVDGADTRNGRQITGRVERLNPKTVTIRTDGGRWRVAYALLFPVIDGGGDERRAARHRSVAGEPGRLVIRA